MAQTWQYSFISKQQYHRIYFSPVSSRIFSYLTQLKGIYRKLKDLIDSVYLN